MEWGVTAAGFKARVLDEAPRFETRLVSRRLYKEGLRLHPDNIQILMSLASLHRQLSDNEVGVLHQDFQIWFRVQGSICKDTNRQRHPIPDGCGAPCLYSR